jgi:hypothetical protein
MKNVYTTRLLDIHNRSSLSSLSSIQRTGSAQIAHRCIPRIFALLLLLNVSLLGACSASKRIERTTVTEDSSPDYYDNRSYERREKTTIKTTESDSSECSGVLSCGVDVIGTVLAYPFKVVGSLLGVLF